MRALIFAIPAAREIQYYYYYEPHHINPKKVKAKVIGLKIISPVRAHYLAAIKSRGKE